MANDHFALLFYFIFMTVFPNVICYDGTIYFPKNGTTGSGNIRLAVSPGDEVFSMYGGRPRGQVEVKVNGEWGPICGNDVDEKAAKVICKELGYAGLHEHYKSYSFSHEVVRVFYIGLDCAGTDGTERFLSWCHYERKVGSSKDCTDLYGFQNMEFAGVVCDKGSSGIPDWVWLLTAVILVKVVGYTSLIIYRKKFRNNRQTRIDRQFLISTSERRSNPANSTMPPSGVSLRGNTVPGDDTPPYPGCYPHGTPIPSQGPSGNALQSHPQAAAVSYLPNNSAPVRSQQIPCGQCKDTSEPHTPQNIASGSNPAFPSPDYITDQNNPVPSTPPPSYEEVDRN